MEDYTLGLALFDFLPVLVSGFGLFCTARLCQKLSANQSSLLYIPAGIILSAGITKASWKTIWVTTRVDIAWMSTQLFFTLAAGYTLLAFLIAHCIAVDKQTRVFNNNWWLMPLTLVAVLTGAALLLLNSGGRSWLVLLLATLTLSNMAVIAMLVRYAWKQHLHLITAGLCVNLCLTFGLVGLARIPDQSAALQWVAEISNLVTHSLFAACAWGLLRRRTAS